MAAKTIAFVNKNDAGSTVRTYNLQFSKFDGTAAPGVSDDDTAGYVAGSLWADRTNHKIYVCIDNSTGAAVWLLLGSLADGTYGDVTVSSGGTIWTVPPSLDYYSAENKEGSTIDAGMACAVHSSGTGVVKASAADNTKIAIGLMRATTADTVSGNVQIEGLFTLSDWTSVIGASTLAAKTTYFLDPLTAGKLTATVPTTTGQTVQIVGTAVSTTTLDLDVGVPILL